MKAAVILQAGQLRERLGEHADRVFTGSKHVTTQLHSSAVQIASVAQADAAAAPDSHVVADGTGARTDGDAAVYQHQATAASAPGSSPTLQADASKELAVSGAIVTDCGTAEPAAACNELAAKHACSRAANVAIADAKMLPAAKMHGGPADELGMSASTERLCSNEASFHQLSFSVSSVQHGAATPALAVQATCSTLGTVTNVWRNSLSNTLSDTAKQDPDSGKATAEVTKLQHSAEPMATHKRARSLEAPARGETMSRKRAAV